MSVLYVQGYNENGDIVDAYPVQYGKRKCDTVRKAKKYLALGGAVRFERHRVFINL